jgi:hypothetical protein
MVLVMMGMRFSKKYLLKNQGKLVVKPIQMISLLDLRMKMRRRKNNKKRLKKV